MSVITIYVGSGGILAVPGFLIWFRVKTWHAPWVPLAVRVAQESNPEPSA